MKHIIKLCVIAAVFGIFGCSQASDYQTAVYDNNAYIAAEGDSWSYFARVVKPDTAESRLSAAFKKFYGSHTVWSMASAGTSDIFVTYTCIITDGEFKTVLIEPDGAVVTIFEGSGDGSETFRLDQGRYRIKLVGRNAHGDVDISVTGTNGAAIEKVY